MDKIKELQYKGYTIEIHSQSNLGDNTKLFFGVWKDQEKTFSVWEKISGTESRSVNVDEILNLLEDKGVSNIKRIIDDENFELGKEYVFWESRNN